MKKLILCVLLLIILSFNSFAQTTTATPKTDWESKEFPLWAHDLRRAEVILFGAFPFAWFTTSMLLDIYRSATHNWDNRYYPWPLKPAGAVEMTTNEWMICIYGSVIISVGVAAADFIMTQIDRKKQKNRAGENGDGDLIIITKPLDVYVDEAVTPPDAQQNSGGSP